LDNINGFIRFDSISLTNQNKTLNVDEIQFISRIEKDVTHFGISSDFINGAFTGNFTYSTIGYTINRILQKYLPALAGTSSAPDEKKTNHIDVDLRITNTSDISHVFELPYTLEGISTIIGFIDENSNRIDLSVNIPAFISGKQKVENINLILESQRQKLQATTRAQLHENNGLINLFLIASASKDTVRTQLGWQNTDEVTNAGEFQAITKLRNENKKIAAQVSVLPTQIIISDSIWNIHPCKIDLNSDKSIKVQNFRFDSNRQFVHINGIASKSQSDSLKVNMNDLNLDFLMGLLKLDGISIGGIVTGEATIFSLLEQPIFEADLFVKDARLNHKIVGNATIHSTWDKQNKQVVANGVFLRYE
jgi:hypothetical protein